MSFLVRTPCNRLTPYIKCLVVREADVPGPYTVLPDASIVLGFQYKGGLSLLKNDRERIELSTAGATGLRKSYRTFVNSRDTGTILVYFTETGAAHFFDFPVHELFDGSYSLRDIYLHADVLNVEDRLAGASNDLQRITVVEDFLIAKLNDREEDSLVLTAVSLLKEKGGNVRIEELAKSLFISQSRFEKRFRSVVGTSPKSFSSIVRFQKAIRDLQTSATLTEVAYRAGYFDQAHFIKDFKSFSGQTPERFLKACEAGRDNGL